MLNKYYISDIHADFYIAEGTPKVNYEAEILKLVSSQIKGYKKEELKEGVLILGGDYSNRNDISKIYLSQISKLFKEVYMVFGNHDYYLCTSKEKYAYGRNSYKKVKDIENYVNGIGNVTILKNFKIHTMSDGTTISGDTLWYSVKGNREMYNEMSDSVKILNMPIQSYHEEGVANFERLKEQGGSDIIVSHVPPIETDSTKDKRTGKLYKWDTGKGCYVTEVEIGGLKNKVWLSGHVHEEGEYKLGGGKLLLNAQGYKGELDGERVIKKIEI